MPANQALEKLNRTYELHLQRGFRPISYRGGRYSSGEVTHGFLLDHRFVVDSSVCPFATWPDEGAPNYYQHSLRPTVIASNAADGHQLCRIPLTRLFTRRPFQFWNSVHHIIETSPLSKLRLIGIMERINLVRRIWLNFETESTEAMLWVVRHAHRLNLPYLCFTVHSSSLSVGPSPYARTAEQVDRILNGVERVLAELAADPRFQPATLAEIGTHFLDQNENQQHTNNNLDASTT
ncbi:MAG: hypothetical protein R3C53_09985 [Pirellulaceae bacterium]